MGDDRSDTCRVQHQPGHDDDRADDGAGRSSRNAQRQRIPPAARELIVQQGYRAATVAAVARTAGVHEDTVYELVGRKPVVRRELIERAVSGTDGAVSAEERDTSIDEAAGVATGNCVRTHLAVSPLPGQ